MPRWIWVDNAKAMAMYLVVLGHFQSAYAPLPYKNLIYAFHVPAFLILTGFLLPPDLGRRPVGALLRRYPLLFARAYALFSAMAILIWWATGIAGARGWVDPMPAVLGALYGVAGAGNGLVHQDIPLWYFPFLTTAILAAILVTRGPLWLAWGLAAAYALFSLAYHGPRLPWCLDIAGIGLVFLLIGHQLRLGYGSVRPMIESRGALLAAPLLAALTWWVTRVNGGSNINGADFGANGALYFLGAAAGSLMLFILAARLPRSELAEAISRATIVIFCLHFYFVVLLGKLIRPAPGLFASLSAIALAVLVTLACLALTRPLRPLLLRAGLLR